MNKPYYILTNDASKSPETAAERYQSYGLDIPSQRILTSGLLLKDYFDSHSLEGATCAVLGTEESRYYVETAGGRIVSLGERFSVLVIAMFENALKQRYPNRTDLRFVQLGKPQQGLYQKAMALSGTRNMVMISDQLDTDILGAANFGLDTALVQTGPFQDRWVSSDVGILPTYCLRSVAI